MFVLLILKQYWKQFAICLLIIGATTFLYFHVYNKGKKACEETFQKVVIEESVKRTNEADKQEEKGREINHKIQRDREKNPVDDGRDSCLLSGDPFKSNCLPK